MSDFKHLENSTAIKKIQEMVDDSPITMFCTNLTQIPFSACPMSTQKVEDSGAIWFMSSALSNHTRDLQVDNRVQLVYENHGASAYLTIFGTAEILYDREKIEEFWSPLAKVWFQEGKDDPDLTLIKVTPEEGYYWDTKNGKMVSFMKMLASVVSGKTIDGGIQGGLRV
jgi:general stress protein 26